tara:strand:- start:19324 stop:20574 length:1251 start_codon:yes stop_codon:yes gene_type:complete
MKLNINFIKNIGKTLIIGFIIIYCIYILYFFNSNLVEGFSKTFDCSFCEMKPTSGNCFNIKNINIANNNVEYTDSSYIFCPWDQNCPNLSNNKGINEITCCSGSNFYNTNNLKYADVSIVNDSLNKCFPDFSNNGYCLDLSNSVNSNFTGMVFKNVIKNSNILLDNNLTIPEILNYQNSLELKNNVSKTDLESLNNELKQLDLNNDTDKNRKKQIQEDLVANYFKSKILDEIFNYKLLDKSLTMIGNNNQYILNKNEFLDCFGNKKTINTAKFSEAQKKQFINKDYFDIAEDASYTTMQDTTQRLYPNQQDLEMELKNLEQIPPGGNVPTSVINQYLRAINSFYEKQMDNMMGPKTHTVNQQLVFDNNTLDMKTKSNTFFVYDNSYNNTYDCQPGITNDKNFKYCGPEAYYQDMKF